MRKVLFALLAPLLFVIPSNAHALTFNPNNIISDRTFTDILGMNLNSVKAFLEGGFLANYRTTDFQGTQKTAAEIIYESALRYGVNPKVLIVLLQKEQSLITATNPTQKQLDWATGYAVCDSCPLDDPRIQRWKGFGKQVNSAAAQFIEGYFEDIENTGSVNGKYGPGIPVEVSGQTIIPENAATASLYAYTPHIAGNKLFATLWDQWFSIHYPEGSLIKSSDRPEVYVVKNGLKRHIASYSVLVSRFDENLISIIDQATIDNIPEGSPIKYPNYSLLLIDGGRFLIVDDTIRPFDSLEAFRSLGFQEEELVKAEYSDLTSYTYGDTITKYTQYPTGRLIQIIESGSYFYLQDQYRYFVHPDLLNMQFKRYPIYKAHADEVSGLRDGGFQTISDGYLVRTQDDARIYLISNGTKRWIHSEEAFSSFGWSLDKVLEVDSNLLDLIPEGEHIVLEEQI